MGRFSTNFRTRARAGKVPAAVLELTLGGFVRRFSDSPITSTSQGMYLPYILSWGGISYSATDRTASLQSPTLTVDVEDPAPSYTLSSLFLGGMARTIRGSSAVAYLAYDDIAFADWFKVFGGQVSSVSMIAPRVWRISMRFDDNAVASAVSELHVQTIADNFFSTAADDVLGTEIPIIYGKNALPPGGAVLCTKCSTDGDPASSTNPHRYIVCAGRATSVTKIYKDGVIAEGTPVGGTHWFWTLRNGVYFTEVGFAAPAFDEPVSVDVWGLSTEGEGSTTEADLITNPAKQIEHLLTNFIFNRWNAGDYFSASSVPIDTASITTVESYFDKIRGSERKGSNVLRRQSALTALNDWSFQNQVGVWWNIDGELRFAVRDPFDTDVYLDDNSPANWPWFESDVHGRGQNAFFPYAENDQQVMDRITARSNFVDQGSLFRDDRIVQDFNRTLVSAEEMQLKWSDSDMSTVGPVDFDVASRRLRRYRFPPRTLTVNSSIALLDPNLFDGVLVSDPDAPAGSGLEWGKDKIWKPRLFSLLSQNINLNTKTVQLTLEDDRDYRCTLWTTGRGEVTETNRGIGMPILSQVTGTFTRGTKAWVPNIQGQIVRLGNNIPKLTPDGFLFEGPSTNWIKNSAFVAGFTDWTTSGGGTASLSTTVLVFQPTTAADLSGTNQTVKLATVASAQAVLDQTTAHTFNGSSKGSCSILHRDNTGVAAVVRIQNINTTNWLTTGGSWSGSEQSAFILTDSAGEWLRESVKFLMEGTGSTLKVRILSGGGTAEDNHIGHVQMEDTVAFPTSIMVSGSGSTSSRSRDLNSHANSDPTRSFKWYEQGTFRCTYKPEFDAADLITGDKHTIFEVLNSTPTTLMKLLYEENAGSARFNLAWDFSGGDAAVATITHDVVAGEVYRIVGNWIGVNNELNFAQGTLQLWVYDPVVPLWLFDLGVGTQNSSVSTATFRIGDGVATPNTAWGHISEFEVLPFVLGSNEIKAFP